MSNHATLPCYEISRARPVSTTALIAICLFPIVSCQRQNDKRLSQMNAPLLRINTVTSGIYQFQSAIPFDGSRGICWQVITNSGRNIVEVQQVGCTGAIGQKFRIGDIGSDGFRTITPLVDFPNFQFLHGSFGTRNILTADNSLSTPSDQGPISIPALRFHFDDAPELGGRRFITTGNDSPGRSICIDRPTDAPNEFDPIQLFPCNHTIGQEWILLGPQ